jgi:hypothetical protein
LLAIVIVEFALNLWGPRSAMEKDFTRIRDEVADRRAPRIQVLGDSVAAEAILGSIMCAGRDQARNDAIGGGGPAFSYLLVAQQIQAGRVPEAVVIAHSPHTFSGTRFPVLVGRFAHWSEMPDIVWNSDDLRGVAYGLLTRFSYLLAYRDELKNLTQGEARFFVTRTPERKTEFERLAEHDRLLAQARFQPRNLGEGIWPMYKEEFSVAPLVDRYFRRLLELLKQHNVKVYWATLPVTERVSHVRRGIGYDERFYAYLDQFRVEGYLHFLQREVLVYEDRYFDDLSHLNMDGALRFSRHLAGAMRECRDLPLRSAAR